MGLIVVRYPTYWAVADTDVSGDNRVSCHPSPEAAWRAKDKLVKERKTAKAASSA